MRQMPSPPCRNQAAHRMQRGNSLATTAAASQQQQFRHQNTVIDIWLQQVYANVSVSASSHAAVSATASVPVSVSVSVRA